MKLRIQYIVIFSISCFAFSMATAQNMEIENVLSKVTKQYEDQEQFQIDVTYAMHRGFTGNKITESYKGKVLKKGNYSYFEVLGSKIIQFPDAQLIFDQRKKTITYAKKTNTGLNNSPLNITRFLTMYDKTKITAQENTLICEMVSTAKNVQLSYGKVVLYVDKSNFRIKKQELFFSNVVPFTNTEKKSREMDYARLIITMDHKTVALKKTPQISDYFIRNTSGKMRLLPQYNEYQLINQSN